MKIVLASTSAVKVEACSRAFGPSVEIVTVKAPSGVNEQPLNEETLRGAKNRLAYARREVPDADYYVSIENGVFDEGSAYVDRAVVTVENAAGEERVTYSDGVVFPDEDVEEARRRGLDKWTVGRVMEEKGHVKKHDDLHLCLSGRSRVSYLDEALSRAAASLPGA